jgi:hypothetical protein
VGMTQHLRKVQRGSTGRANVTTRHFQDALRTLDRAGAIERTETHIKILDRTYLKSLAAVSGDPE